MERLTEGTGVWEKQYSFRGEGERGGASTHGKKMFLS